jgi:predicted nucleic acid-binding protein
MAIEFLDANVILRYFLQDHPDFSPRANQLFADLSSGTISLVVSEAVITEVVHVLCSPALYAIPRPAIRNHLQSILEWPSFDVPQRSSILRALDIYATITIDFVDALTVAHMEREHIQSVVSFDRDFDKVKSITRREP